MKATHVWWLAVAVALGAAAGCGDDDRPRGDAGGDGGMSDGAVDCTSVPNPCTTAGTSCDADALVTCTRDTNGCLVETRSDCGATGGTCDATATPPACTNDPCAGVPAADRCSAPGTTCEDNDLVVCAANAEGCNVRTVTDCAASPGGACDPTPATPVCALPPDPCEAIPAADRCTTEGTSCDADNLITCAPDAFGCLVNTTTACDSRAGGTCDSTGTAACTFTGDPCAGITECATEGASCSGASLVRCARDGFGCLVESTTDCTSTMFGFCDEGATPVQCSTAAVDPCMGMTECTPEGRACDSDTLRVCAQNAFGCLVETATDCTTTDEVCGDSGGMAVCGDLCSFRATCPAATYCDGSELVTCTADADGCLIESDRSACTDSACVPSSGMCSATCTGASPTIIDCASGTVTGDTTGGPTAITAYEPCTTSTLYAGPERVFYFVNDGPPQDVQIVSTRDAGSTSDFDLFVLDGGDGSAMCGTADTCVAASRGVSATETVNFGATAGSLHYVVYDIYSSTTATSPFTLDVTCTPIICGDGDIGSTEGCDDSGTTSGDGCSDTCTVEAGYLCAGEPSVCDDFASITETEPNDDGTPSTGGSGINGNDVDATAITNADANGAITDDTIVSAALSPAGDEDVFAVSNAGSADVMVTVYTGIPTVGACPSGDTGIRVLASDLSEIGHDDDGGPGACSMLTVTIPAGTTYYVQVTEYGDDTAIAAYQLVVDFE